jgi:hypothetical protein
MGIIALPWKSLETAAGLQNMSDISYEIEIEMKVTSLSLSFLLRTQKED